MGTAKPPCQPSGSGLGRPANGGTPFRTGDRCTITDPAAERGIGRRDSRHERPHGPAASAHVGIGVPPQASDRFIDGGQGRAGKRRSRAERPETYGKVSTWILDKRLRSARRRTDQELWADTEIGPSCLEIARRTETAAPATASQRSAGPARSFFGRRVAGAIGRQAGAISAAERREKKETPHRGARVPGGPLPVAIDGKENRPGSRSLITPAAMETAYTPVDQSARVTSIVGQTHPTRRPKPRRPQRRQRRPDKQPAGRPVQPPPTQP